MIIRNAANTDAGTLKEVVSNLSTNKNEIYFRIRLKDESVVHVGYDFETFNKQLDTVLEGGTVSFINNNIIKNKCLFSYKQSSDDATLKGGLTPYGLCQGTDITNLEYIYIVTGNEAEGKALYLGYMNAKGGNQNKYKLDVVSSNGSKWEVEGIQFYDSNTIYIGICPAGSGVDKSRAYIYSIQKNEL